MALCLLDTDGLIDYTHGIQSTVAFIGGLVGRGEIMCVCDVVVTELYAGLRPQQQEAAEELLTSCEFLQADLITARQAGEWRSFYRSRGVTLGLGDSLLAATAVAHSPVVVTGNLRHFPMPEVTVLPLPRARWIAREPTVSQTTRDRLEAPEEMLDDASPSGA